MTPLDSSPDSSRISFRFPSAEFLPRTHFRISSLDSSWIMLFRNLFIDSSRNFIGDLSRNTFRKFYRDSLKEFLQDSFGIPSGITAGFLWRFLPWFLRWVYRGFFRGFPGILSRIIWRITSEDLARITRFQSFVFGLHQIFRQLHEGFVLVPDYTNRSVILEQTIKLETFEDKVRLWWGNQNK